MKDAFKNQKALLGLVVVMVLITTVSLTYAYFTVTRNAEQDPNDEVVTTGRLNLDFTDGTYLFIDQARPGAKVEKTFRVTNSGTLPTYYSIGWASLTNPILHDELVLRYTCTSYVNYGQGTQAVSGTCASLTNTPVGNNHEVRISSNIAVPANITHVYNLTVEFLETSSEQNYNQGLTFSGTLNILESVAP